MRNHQKIHPSLNFGSASSKRATITRGDEEDDGERNDYGNREQSEGELYNEEHQQQTAHDEAGDFPREEEIGGSLGNSQPPACAGFQKFYCDASDDYPT